MSNRIYGGEYRVSDEERAHFAECGYVHLRGLLTSAEVGELELTYDRFLHREIEVPGNDYCDMAGDYGRDSTAGFRRAYVIAFRSESTVEIERQLGFTHSHNDKPGVLNQVGVEGQTR